MPYKNIENKKEYNHNYWKLRKAGYSIKDMLESKKCLWCNAELKPKSERHKYCKNACCQRDWQKNACHNGL